MTTIVQTSARHQTSLAHWHGWLPLLVLPASAIALIPVEWPRWVQMWLLAVAIYAGCKWVTWRRTPASGAEWWRHVAYLLLWPGLDAAAFLGRRTASRPALAEWLLAAAKLGLGLLLLWGVAARMPREYELLLGWIGMTGIVFVLHFGSIHLLSCFWRSLGIESRPLMEWPIAAASVSEFWSRRWNTAFRDLAHLFVFRPLVRRWGGAWALAASFLFSGLVHDLVISVPARGGYGWPTLFFLVQGAAVFVERSPLGKSLGLGSGGRGRLFAMLVLLLPAYGLFHPPFIHTVIVPFLEAIGAARPN